MKRLRFLLLALLFCQSAHSAGNGSSGVGNKLAVGDGVGVRLGEIGSLVLSKSGTRILDGKTAEPLFRLDHVNKQTLLIGAGELVPSRLGEVSGFEYIPSAMSRITSEGNSFWLVCGTPEACLRFTPLSRTNPKVETAMGALSRVKN